MGVISHYLNHHNNTPSLLARFASTQATSLSPLGKYQQLIENGSLQWDEKQESAMMPLDALYRELEKVNFEVKTPPSSGGKSWPFSLTQSWFASNKPSFIKGVYTHGSVGCGKTMIMDMFFDMLPMQRKRRVHFYAWMLEVHERIHQWKKENKGSSDPILPIAKQIRAETDIICFDEFQVVDVADAMLIRRLISILWDDGLVLVCTSNRPPTDLYYRGFQREAFLPFIDLLQEKCRVHSMDNPVDYRKIMGALPTLSSTQSLYLTPVDSHTTMQMEELYQQLTGERPERRREALEVSVQQGRILRCERGNLERGVAYFEFDELCARPLGAADYIALSRNFHTVFLLGIPILSMSMRTEARRFITLIDELYEHSVRVVVQANVPPMDIFRLEGKVNPDAIDDGFFHLQKDAPNIFTGEDERFASERTMSRLIEMQSETYLQGVDKRWTMEEALEPLE